MKDLLVRAQVLGGHWESLGADSARGIVVEDLTADADGWGPRSCSFTLRRRTNVPWPDIGAFAPLEIESQGLLVWSGRVKGTPTTDGSDRKISINGEGWQYHLDDDAYQRTYVHTSLTDFMDARAFPATPLLTFRAGYQVNVGGGGIVLAWPNAQVVVSATAVGVTLDFGPSLCKRFVISVTSSNNTTDQLFIRGSDAPDGGATPGDTDVLIVNNAGPNVASGTFTTPRRYVHLFFDDTGSGTFTPSADVWIRILTFLAVSDTAYESGNLSVLKASQVVLDALTRATLLLSPDRSLIQATTFSLPEFDMKAPATPREVITAANAFHNYQFRVRADKVPEYRPQPAGPAIQVDARSTFDEASAGDASKIYSSVIVTYTGPDGVAASVPRSQSAAASIYSASLIQPTNPSALVDALNWTATGTGVALTRTTTAGEFTTAPGGFKLAGTGTSVVAQTSAWTGPAFIAGQSYRLTVDAKTSVAGTLTYTVSVIVDGVTVTSSTTGGNLAFQTFDMSWVQPSNSAPVIQIKCTTTSGLLLTGLPCFFDNVLLYEGNATLVNRRGFRRTYTLDTNMSLTPAGAQQIGDTFLAAHRTIPLKGSLVVTGYGTAKRNPSGASMPTAELLLCGGELVRLAHLVDPDTGALCREGRIASVSWDAMSDTATIELDSESQNFEAMLARLALVTGQVPA